MAMHLGATLGLAVGGIATALRTIHAWKENWDVADTFQSCFTGYSWCHQDWKAERMVFTIPVAAGGAATWAAIKTGYNSWTPKGVNV